MSLKWATGTDFGGELCKALGIEMSEVTRIILDVRAGQLAEIGVVRLLKSDQGERINEVISHYHLVKVQDEIEEGTRELEEAE